VARQPIFDRRQRVFGYELLFRSGRENAYQAADGEMATGRVITDSLLNFGPESMTRGKRAFINFTRAALLEGYAELLPAHWVVVEVLESVEPDPEVVGACRALRDKGYTLALDDFVYHPRFDPLLELASIVKVDLLATQGEDRARQLEKINNFGVELLAEKVESHDEYQDTREAGFSLFQGYFFSKPVILAGRDVPVFKLAYLRLLQEINRPDLDLAGMEKVIKGDISLSYKLLRYINSAYFSLREPVNNLQQAMSLMGEENVRKWASLVALAQLGQDKPDELIVSSLVRAKFLEDLAARAGLKGRENEVFLMGLFSLLEPLVGRPLAEVMDDIPIAQEIKAALHGQPGRMHSLLALALAYERGDWDSSARLSEALGLEEGTVPGQYLSALRWSQLLMEGAA
jgi:EAL and modified HD-GYP domain-containing signal transduction protein